MTKDTHSNRESEAEKGAGRAPRATEAPSAASAVELQEDALEDITGGRLARVGNVDIGFKVEKGEK